MLAANVHHHRRHRRRRGRSHGGHPDQVGVRAVPLRLPPHHARVAASLRGGGLARACSAACWSGSRSTPPSCTRVVASIEEVFGAAGRDEALWAAMKDEHSRLMAGRGDLELAETFYNSVTRKVFTTVGVDARARVRAPRHGRPPRALRRGPGAHLPGHPGGEPGRLLDELGGPPNPRRLRLRGAVRRPRRRRPADRAGDREGRRPRLAVGAATRSTSWRCWSRSSSATRARTWSAGWCAASGRCPSSWRSSTRTAASGSTPCSSPRRRRASSSASPDRTSTSTWRRPRG